ncbi:MAG: hypothetical protein ACLFVK_05800, partial [Dehalococcoidia bacterium]
MSIKLRVPPNLFMLTGYQKIVETTGQNVGECIDDLDSQFPGAKRMLCDKQGQLLNYLFGQMTAPPNACTMG